MDSIIQKLAQKEQKLEILTEIKSGKEATVFAVRLDDELLAMKLYRENTSLKSKNNYLEGKFYHTKSYQKAINTKNKFGRNVSKNNWIKREFSLLQQLFKNGANVPEPILQIENVIFMQFIGQIDKPALRLKDMTLNNQEAEFAWAEIIKNIKIFLKIGIIHGDLSAYNILWWQEKIWIIDFPQAIDIRQNQQKDTFLMRDLQNIYSYFQSYFSVDLSSLEL